MDEEELDVTSLEDAVDAMTRVMKWLYFHYGVHQDNPSLNGFKGYINEFVMKRIDQIHNKYGEGLEQHGFLIEELKKFKINNDHNQS